MNTNISVNAYDKKEDINHSCKVSMKDLVNSLSVKELTDLNFLIINDPLLRGKIEKETLKQKDQIDISDIHKLFPEIDPTIIKEILLKNLDDERVSNLLAQKDTVGYGGVTLIRIAKIILDNLDDTKFNIDELKGRVNDKYSNFSLAARACAWEPRDNWSIPINEEIGVNQSNIADPFIIVETSEDRISFKTFYFATWEFIKAEKFKSKEKIDSFIKAIIEAREKVFGADG